MLPGGPVSNNGQETHEREPSDEDEYDGHHTTTYPRGASIVERNLKGDAEDDEELPDTTMLDSVILPAIASVSSVPVSPVGSPQLIALP